MRGLLLQERGLYRYLSILFCLLGIAVPAQAQEVNQLTQVEVLETDGATEIVLHGTSSPTFTVFKLSDPTRLFIDISKADISGIRSPIEVDNGVISQIAALQYSDDVAVVGRLIVSLDVDAPYTVKAKGNSLLVIVDASRRTDRKPVAVGAKTDGAVVAKAIAKAEAAERITRNALRRAQEAEAQAVSAEARAKEAEQRSARLAIERDQSSVAREAAQAAALSATAQAQEAQARARAAEAQMQVAQAQAKEVEAQAREATAKTETESAKETQQAMARARIAEIQARETEAKAARLARDASEMQAKARTASARADGLALELKQHQTEKNQAEARAQGAESRAQGAESRAQGAEDRLIALKSKIQSADKAAAAADAHAVLIARKAEIEAQQAVEAAQQARNAQEQVSAAEKRANLAETRAAKAEAARSTADAERMRLNAQLAQLEQQRADADAQIARLEGSQARIANELETAHQAKDVALAEVLEARQTAQAAEQSAEQARVARIESVQATSVLEQRMAQLDTELTAARAAERSGEVDRLQGLLSTAHGEATVLRATLQNRNDELVAARKDAAQRKLEVAQLNSDHQALEAKRATEQVAAKQAATAERVAVKQATAERVAAERVAAERVAAEQVAAEQVAAEQAAAEQAAAEQAVTERVAERVAAERVAAKQATAEQVAQAKVRISDVKFEDGSAKTLIRIRFSGKPVYRVTQEGERTRVLEFQNAQIDPAIERSLDTSEFPSAVQIVSSFQAPPPAQAVRVAVTLSEQVQDQLVLTGDTLNWSFAKPQAPSVAYAVPPPPKWSAPAPIAPSVQAPLPPVNYERPQAAAFVGLSAPRRSRKKAKRRYTGRRINIDIKDGDIHNILRLLAREGNVNIVTSDDVKGNVTVHLKLVPWDQALDIILRTKGLGQVRDGDIIRVSPADMIAKERNAELKALEVKEKLKPLQVKLIAINYASASELMPQVKSVLGPRGTAIFDQRTNTLIIKDVIENLEAADDLISRLDTQTPQVQIEARIVEVNMVDVKQLGIQWGGQAIMSPALGNGTGLSFPGIVGLRGGADDAQSPTSGTVDQPNFIVNLPAAAGGGSGGALGMTFGSLDGAFNLNVRLSALENKGRVKIVSSPKIMTLDNERAVISQGVAIPISQVSAAGVQTVYKNAELKLEVTPHVTQDGNIYMKIKMTNSTPDFQNVGARGDPTILSKVAETKLLIKDSDTTVIGGIYTSNSGENVSEVPYLARLPIIGALFRNHQEADRRSEMLIFITPRIVNRSAARVRTAK